MIANVLLKLQRPTIHCDVAGAICSCSRFTSSDGETNCSALECTWEHFDLKHKNVDINLRGKS